MKTTNKKEFSKFLNKFEKLLSYNIENLGMGVKFDIFKNDTQKLILVISISMYLIWIKSSL